MTEHNNETLIESTVEIVAAYVERNPIAPDALPSLISSVFNSLKGLGGAEPPPEPKELVPAVPVKKSVTNDFIICLEDGKRFKSLKRHLRTAYNLTPDEYRTKWGLAADYPMVAPAYAASRSELAKRIGLGRKG
jgi:predicted transcriptional regulator